MDPRRLLVLVADDEAPLREAMSELLESEGHRVVSAADGQQALECAGGGARPCAILLDWMMPTLDGEGFLEARAASAALSNIPVFVLSASRHPIRDGRIQGFLQKPFAIEDLLKLLGEVCERHCAYGKCIPPGGDVACDRSGAFRG
jgi:CheY-like chemotaxis protein